MKIIKLGEKNFEVILNFLQDDKIVVVPTETAYGLLGNAIDEDVVKRVFKIKKRDVERKLSVFVRDLKMAEEYVEVDERVKEIADEFLPGPLTLVLRTKKAMPFVRNALGIRISSYPLVEYIMSRIDFPMTATSANLTGQGAVYSAKEVLEQFEGQKDQPDLVVDGGDLSAGRISTVVDLTGRNIKCLREGVVKLTDLK